MDSVIAFIGPIFWGLVLLSALVFVHEGGHFLAARACGVRVLEFFLGMPCRFNVHHVSKRIGTKFGVTPILLGGYAEICGMDPTNVPCAPQVLGSIHRHGIARVADLASELGVAVPEIEDACSLLYGWGSIVPWDIEAEHGEGASQGSKGFPLAFAAAARDAAGNTVYDGRAFNRASATKVGESWTPPMGDQTFFDAERAHTYVGKGFWKRSLMLVAGIAVNILTGFLLVVAVYSVLGVSTPVDVNVIGGVIEGSCAEEAGLKAGDRIQAVDGHPVDSWMSLLEVLDSADKKTGASLEVWRPHDQSDAFEKLSADEFASAGTWAREHGDFLSIDVSFDEEGALGINVSTKTIHLGPLQSCQIAVDNIISTAQSVMSLLNPAHTMEILDNSTSVVGISVMSAEAAAEGPSSFLNLAALISFSLGFMNLLPIPPLDGGKLLIETIQAITRREVPVKVQGVISVVGIVLFGVLFLYMLRADFLRFF